MERTRIKPKIQETPPTPELPLTVPAEEPTLGEIEYNKPMRRSRRDETYEIQTKRNLLFLVVGIIILTVGFFMYGNTILTKLVTLSGNYHREDEAVTNESENFVLPPSLNPTFTATNSAKVTISGTGKKGETIKLFINDEYVDKTTVDDDNTFEIKNFSLNDGENVIKAKAINKDNKNSEYSNEIKISYINKELDLSIDYPSDGTHFQKEEKNLTVKGKTAANAKVTVNGFWGIVDANGSYRYDMTLKGGDNEINIVATDDAGNKIEKKIKVNYSE